MSVMMVQTKWKLNNAELNLKLSALYIKETGNKNTTKQPKRAWNFLTSQYSFLTYFLFQSFLASKLLE